MKIQQDHISESHNEGWILVVLTVIGPSLFIRFFN